MSKARQEEEGKGKEEEGATDDIFFNERLNQFFWRSCIWWSRRAAWWRWSAGHADSPIRDPCHGLMDFRCHVHAHAHWTARVQHALVAGIWYMHGIYLR
jgi:hypothetical protein